jgi:tetratricopeptide (TPR) repeat protein
LVASVFFLESQLRENRSGIIVRWGIPCLLALMGLTTLQRTLVWKSNLTLYADTTLKSPTFSNIWNEYAVALINNGELERAKSALIKAGALHRLEYDEKSDINIAGILLLQGKEAEAMRMFTTVISKTKGKSTLVYEHILSHLYDKSLTTRDPVEKRKISVDLLRYSQKLYALNKDPFLLFRMGQIYSSLGDRQHALDSYKQAYSKFREGEKYKVFAQKLIARLEKE